jgi:hypothetical protein
MIQETAQFDLRNMITEPSAETTVYTLLLFVVFIVAGVSIIKIWWMVPPFRGPRAIEPLVYRRLLETTRNRLRQWMLLAFLVWGLCESMEIGRVTFRLLGQPRNITPGILFAVRDFTTGVNMVLIDALLIFLLRWHILQRIERLRD